MRESIVILTLLVVGGWYLVAICAWLHSKGVRPLRAVCALRRKRMLDVLVGVALVVCFVQKGATKVTNGNDRAVSPLLAPGIGSGEASMRDGAAQPEGVRFVSIEVSYSNVTFAAAWPAGFGLPEGLLDLYVTRDVGTNYWDFLGYYDVSLSGTNFTGEVSFASLPFAPTNRLFLCLGTRADLDCDGLVDAREKMQYGTSPLLLDSDGDGIADGVEKNAVPPLDPCSPDTDGDGYLDGEELLAGTDPLSPNAGAGGTIRYYYDQDDRLLEAHAGMAEASSRVEFSPAGNELKTTLGGVFHAAQ